MFAPEERRVIRLLGALRTGQGGTLRGSGWVSICLKENGYVTVEQSVSATEDYTN